jgi:ribosomal protein S18 acetylase RimI-like enzyme
MDRRGTSERTRASTENAAAVYALIVECSLWLRENGIAQWDPVYPRQRFDLDVAAGTVWFWPGPSAIDATVTLMHTRPDYYPERIWCDEGSAWYICRFAIARRLKGTGLGPRLLTEILAAASAERIGALRLDVGVSNPFLARYYQANGFSPIARGEIKGAGSIFLERAVR